MERSVLAARFACVGEVFLGTEATAWLLTPIPIQVAVYNPLIELECINSSWYIDFGLDGGSKIDILPRR